MQKHLETLLLETKRDILKHHGKRLTTELGRKKALTLKDIDPAEIFPLDISPEEDLALFVGRLEALEEIASCRKAIAIDFTESDLDDLRAGETFDWTYDGIDVHLFNSDVVDTSKSAPTLN